MKTKPLPWVKQAIFPLDGIPVIEELKGAWHQIRDEYLEARYGAALYPLTEIYSGQWLITSLRSNSVEIGYLSFEQRIAEIIPCVGAASVGKMSPDEVNAAFCKCCDEEEALNRARHPTLSAILEPLYPHACFMYNYSLMRPGVRLSPHAGIDSGCVRVHLGLREDPNCWLNVMGVQRTWKDGEVFGFDDANIHLAEHHGDRDRLVVIMDFKKTYIEEQLHKKNRTKERSDQIRRLPSVPRSQGPIQLRPSRMDSK